MKQIYQYYFFLIVLVLVEHHSYGQISGQTWQDHNANGMIDVIEKWQPNISVKAYNSTGKIIASATTDASGNYKLDVPDNQKIRIEFGGIHEGLVATPGHTLIHFVTSPAVASLGLYNPNRFIGTKPKAVQTVYALGSLDNADIDSIASIVGYFANPSDTLKYKSFSAFKNTGSVWGLAYDRQNKRLFSSAIAKRHSALGSHGTGGIYITSVDSNVTKPFLNLDALGFPTVGAPLERDLSKSWGVADHDSLMFSQIGKIGLGGLDLSDDSRYLYTVNLYDRHLYRIKLNEDGTAPVPSEISKFLLPIKAFKGGEGRPFAVKYHNGLVYVGVVCDAQLSQKATDLQAYIYSIEADDAEPAKVKFKEVNSFSLDYPRGVLDYNVKGWFPWTDNYLQALVPSQSGWMIYPQPMVADIEFDNDGSMIVSLMDRLGHQTGDGQLYRPRSGGSFLTSRGLSGGDVLRFSKVKKNFETEQNGQAGARISAGQYNGEGPGGGEFYAEDAFTKSGVTWHHETATGGLAILPDKNSLLVSVREPDRYVAGGVKWFSNETGSATHAFSVFPGGMKRGYFWKSNNVGDIELITELPSTEIGDRVWLDNDGDGTQGADEPALANITLELYRDNRLLGNTVSDHNGKYIFNIKNIPGGIKPRTSYEIRVPLKQPSGNYTTTAKNQGASSELDSDAQSSSEEYASVHFHTTNPGENIHNLDVGFQCNDKPQVSLRVQCNDNKASVTVAGQKEDQRFDLSPGNQYNGYSDYTVAKRIETKGLITEAAFEKDLPYEATVRIFAPSGCYSDVFVSTLNQKGCTYIQETLSLETPYSIAVYPNPSSGPLKIAYRGNTANALVRIQITGRDGQVLLKHAASLEDGYYRDTADLTNHAPGAYLVTIREGSQTTTKTIIKP